MNKNYTVRKNHDFQRIIKKNKLIRTESYFIYYDFNKMNNSRFGISVSKKLGNAVFRNKIKRQMRNICHLITDKSHPFDLIVIIRKNYLSNTFQENKEILIKSVEKIFKKKWEVKNV